MRGLLLAFAAVSFAAGQTFPPDYPYLVRLDHYAPGEHTCALLQKAGAFHLEIDHGENVKVFEGGIEPSQVAEIQHHLDDPAFANLYQQQIEEPLLSTRRDRLQVTVFRGDGWQDLYFRSIESRQPYKASLQPLVHWLEDLHKLPHREFSEEAGKNNCLPKSPIALSTRESAAPSNPMPRIALNSPPPRMQAQQEPPQAQPKPVSPLFQLNFVEKKQGSAHQRCALVLDDGRYRMEDRSQKSGKPVITEVLRGQITSEQLRQLQKLLSDPKLTAMKHREPPGGGYIPMLVDMLDLHISRPAGVQRIVLSSAFGRAGFPAFYSGDGDIREAEPLMKFMAENLESSTSESLGKDARNDCTQAP